MSGPARILCRRPDCGERVLHEHAGGDYGLEDIPELFQLGRVEPDPQGRECIALNADEIRQLKVFVDAYSFDFDPGLIELALELHRFAQDRREREFVFVQD